MRCIVFSIVVLCAFTCTARAEEDLAGLNYLEQLALHEKETFANIGAYSLSYDQHTENRSGIGPDRLDSHLVVTRSGNLLNVVRQLTRTASPDGELPAASQEVRLSVNPEQIAQYSITSNSNTVNLWQYNDEKELPSVARSLKNNLVDMPMRSVAFGNGDGSYSDIFEEAKATKRWKIFVSTPNRDGQVVMAFMERRNEKDVPAFEMKIDTQRGNIALESHIYTTDGKVDRALSCVPVEVRPGLWLPASWDCRSFDEIGTGVEEKTQATAVEYKLNQSFPDDFFSYLSLGIPNDTPVYRHGGPSGSEELKYVDGALIVH